MTLAEAFAESASVAAAAAAPMANNPNTIKARILVEVAALLAVRSEGEAVRKRRMKLNVALQKTFINGRPQPAKIRRSINAFKDNGHRW